jgi:hypothetical protein
MWCFGAKPRLMGAGACNHMGACSPGTWGRRGIALASCDRSRQIYICESPHTSVRVDRLVSRMSNCPIAATDTTYKMKVEIDPETISALETNLTVRCLYRLKFDLDSRQSEPVICWADAQVKVFSSILLKNMNRKAANITTELLMVQLLASRKTALVCHDLFLEDCSEQVRNETHRCVDQPIHDITKRGDIYRFRRNKRLDATIAAEYTRIQRFDKGPRPYFADALNPPEYQDGKRIERSKDEHGKEGARSEEDQPEMADKAKTVRSE